MSKINTQRGNRPAPQPPKPKAEPSKTVTKGNRPNSKPVVPPKKKGS